MRFTFIFLYFLSLYSCKNESSSNNAVENSNYSHSNDSQSKEEDGYIDGDYCAEINYYYSATGTTSTYILKVEIEDNELVKIYWPNGGWLDNSHFNPPDITDGHASFESDKGVDYTVRIIGEDGDCNYSISAKDEDDLIQEDEDETCPKCGRDKYSWKDFCNRCIDKIENTCSKCEGYEYGINGGICDDCKNEEEQQNKVDEDGKQGPQLAQVFPTLTGASVPSVWPRLAQVYFDH